MTPLEAIAAFYDGVSLGWAEGEEKKKARLVAQPGKKRRMTGGSMQEKKSEGKRQEVA